MIKIDIKRLRIQMARLRTYSLQIKQGFFLNLDWVILFSKLLHIDHFQPQLNYFLLSSNSRFAIKCVPEILLKFWGTVVINCISFKSVRLEKRSKKVKKYKPALSQTEETTQRIRAVNRRENVLAIWLHPRNKLRDIPMTSPWRHCLVP